MAKAIVVELDTVAGIRRPKTRKRKTAYLNHRDITMLQVRVLPIA